MCELLGVEEKKGSPRERQIKDWKRFFKFEKEGGRGKSAFKIIEIYDVEKQKIDGRSKGNNSVYTKHTIPLLARALLLRIDRLGKDDEPYVIELNDKYIKKVFDLYNEDIDNYSEDILIDKIHKENRNIEEFDITEFTNRYKTLLREIIDGSLKGLTKLSDHIDIKNTFKVDYCEKSGIIDARIATESEEIAIDKIYKKFYFEYECKNMFEIYRKNKGKEFFKKVNNELFNKINVKSHHKLYLFKLQGNFINDVSNYNLTDDEADYHKNNLKEQIIKSLSKSANKRYSNSENKIQDKINENCDCLKEGFTRDSNKCNDFGRCRFPVYKCMLAERVGILFPVNYVKSRYVENQEYLANIIVRDEIL